MMGIGNENWGPQYLERLKVFQTAIKAKYPSFKLITSSGTDPDGARYDLLNTELRKMNVEFVDEHYYRKPDWFFSNVKRYDNYTRTGSKVFAGEYASHVDKTNGDKRNTWLAGISIAAFMTGLERNADVVQMASYAPLFAHVDGWQWAPDLIWVNNLNVYGTPDYYVQKLFSLNKGTHVLPLTFNNEAVAGQDSLYASAVVDKATNELIVKIVNASNKQQIQTISVEGVKKLAKTAKLQLLQQNDLTALNSIAAPQQVAPVESVININGKKFDYTAAPYSFSVLRIKLQ
jgi:alpha-L-arabinofuranosidase